MTGDKTRSVKLGDVKKPSLLSYVLDNRGRVVSIHKDKSKQHVVSKYALEFSRAH